MALGAYLQQRHPAGECCGLADIAALCPWGSLIARFARPRHRRGPLLAHTIDKAEALSDADFAPWAKGPKCSVVTAAFRLDVPVKFTKGTVNPNVRLPTDVVDEIRKQLVVEPALPTPLRACL